jgi:tRNA (adenine37-N6)-methyltransferase
VSELPRDPRKTLSYTPIALARTPFKYKEEAPRQGTADGSAEGTLEFFAQTGIDDALDDIEGWERIIILFHFDQARSFCPKVMPPRSSIKRGVLSTRSPHRPNAIGLTVARLLAREGRILRVADLDLLDQTPVLDIKPYVPYADAFPQSRTGWLEQEAAHRQRLAAGGVGEASLGASSSASAPSIDPLKAYVVTFAERAERQFQLLAEEGFDIRSAAARILALGPKPHAYRRIRKEESGDYTLSYKAWRVRFELHEAQQIHVTHLRSGYKAKQLATDPALSLHVRVEARR